MFRLFIIFILSVLPQLSFAGANNHCSKRAFSFQPQSILGQPSLFERRTGDQNTGIAESWLIEKSSLELREDQIFILEKVVSNSFSYSVPYHEKYNKKDIEVFLKEGASREALKSDFVCFLKKVLSEAEIYFNPYGY